MKKLLHEVWFSWHTWLFFGAMTAIVVGLVWLIMIGQRKDYQRSLDASEMRTMERLSREIQALKLENQRTIQNQAAIKEDVREIREVVKP